MFPARPAAAALASVLILAASACGSGGDGAGAGAGDGGRPSVAVTTNVLGDVVGNLVGDHAEVVTVMPEGADPHEFQPSARQVNEIRESDALVVNGGGFEEGLVDVTDAARRDGVPTIAASPAGDPHFFTDPTRMADAAGRIARFLATSVPGLAGEDVAAEADEYVAELRSLDAEIEATLSAVPEADRVLVTDHDVFGAFADRYGFDVVATVIPTSSTGGAVSGAALAEVADLVEAEGVPAIFTDVSSTEGLASTVAEEAGGVEVVELYSESLGAEGSGAATYEDMMRTNAERIADALA